MIRRNTSTLVAVAVAAFSTALTAQSLDTVRVVVDGHQMHLVVGGAGSPTIVLEAGGGSTSRTWRALQPRLAELATVVSYDRAGLGNSGLSSRKRTARAVAEDLHAALAAARLPPPYLLVGHSSGGLYARVFSSIYPTEVSGLVLVDPAPEDFYARAEREFPAVFARLDAVDLADSAKRTPGERAEDDGWENLLAHARYSDATFTGPAIVLSASRPDLEELGPIWTDEHRLWALRSSRREYVMLEGAGHQIHRDRPSVVVDAVRRILSGPKPVSVTGTLLDSVTSRPILRGLVCESFSPTRMPSVANCASTDSLGRFRLEHIWPGQQDLWVDCYAERVMRPGMPRVTLTVSADSPSTELGSRRVDGRLCDQRPLTRRIGLFEGGYSYGFEESRFRWAKDTTLGIWVAGAFKAAGSKQMKWPASTMKTPYPCAYVRWFGTLTGPGQFGHGGMAAYQLVVDSVAQVRAARPPVCR